MLSWIYNRYATPGFLVNSLPKAGTNLLAKVLSLFPGIRTDHARVVHLGHQAWLDGRRPADQGPAVPVTVTWPLEVRLDVCRRVLRTIPRGGYVSTHLPYSPPLGDLIDELKLKTLLILRDPRDVVVSAARFVPQLPDHPFYGLYAPLSESERILLSIRGHEPRHAGEPRLLDIGAACRSLLGWTRRSFNQTSYFHRLVGPEGQGSRAEQLDELGRIAAHLGLWYRAGELERIAEQVFGGTHTFRQGTSGSWRRHFTAEHRDAFQEVAGPLLVEMGFETALDWAA